MKIVPLGSLVKIRTGKLDANASNPKGVYPFFTCSREPLRIDNYSYDCECVLVAGNGDLNVKYFNGKFDAYQRTYIIESLDKSILSVKYLYYFMERYVAKLRGMSIGGVIKYIKLNYLTEARIPLPNIGMQDKIVEILDKAQQLIKKRKAQIEALEQLTQSVFLEMFGDPVLNTKSWEKKQFDYFAKIDTVMIKDFTEYRNYPHIGIENIERDSGRIINYQTVAESNITSGKYLFTNKHIIYSKIRPYLNKVALPDFSGVCSADAYPILVHEGRASRYFFAYLLRSSAFLNHVSKNSERTNIPKVNKQQLLSFKGICPPIKLQLAFEEMCKKIELYKNTLETGLKELENNFHSLLQRAFKGELFAENINR